MSNDHDAQGQDLPTATVVAGDAIPLAELLGAPAQGDGTCRGGYGLPVIERYGTKCAYCDRELGAPYEAWLDLSVDHVVPRNAAVAGVPTEWLEDLLNHVACCRACNEFLNGYRVAVETPATLAGFIALRDSVLEEKRKRASDRHRVEQKRYAAWLETRPGSR